MCRAISRQEVLSNIVFTHLSCDTFLRTGIFLVRIQTRDILKTTRSDNHYTVICDIVLELSFPKLESIMEMTMKTTQFLTQAFYPRPRIQVRIACHYTLLTK